MNLPTFTESPTAPPDADRSLPWRDWDAGRAEARARGVPAFCLAEPSWSTGAQRLALVLAREEGTRALLEDAFVPILVDPVARPDVAARLRWTAAVTTGTAGPPLMVLLTPAGAPFLGYCTLKPEGEATHPSLRSLLRSVADVARERPGELEAQAAELAARAGARVPSAPAAAAWPSVRDAVDPVFGGLRELPKLPRPALLWRLLDEADAGLPDDRDADAVADGTPIGDRRGVTDHLRRTLDGMWRGGVLDQLDGSFHRCGRDERWVVPHFEKLVPVNAALAAVYARAGRRFERPEFESTARGAAAFALSGLDEARMVVAADAGFYTWTPRSVHELLDAGQVQAVGLHVNLTSDDSPHVLFRSLEPERMIEVADEPVDVLRARLEGGLRRMKHARARRPAPARRNVAAPAWYATTLRWLFEAERLGLALDAARLRSHFERLLAGPFDASRGYERDGRFWLEDQVAIAAACLAAAAGPDGAALATARRLADLILHAYVDPATGALCDEAIGRHDAPPRPSVDVVDVDVTAAVPAAIDVLRTLGARSGADRYADAADHLARCHAGALLAVAQASGPAADVPGHLLAAAARV